VDDSSHVDDEDAGTRTREVLHSSTSRHAGEQANCQYPAHAKPATLISSERFGAYDQSEPASPLARRIICGVTVTRPGPAATTVI
jgi:hypothetical protein